MSCKARGSNVPHPSPLGLSGNMSLGVTLLCLALASTCLSLHTGLLEVVLYESVENGDYKTRSYRLNADFTAAGSKLSAEGQLIQLHPLGLCNSLDYDELYNFGWVGVVKLELYEPDQCLSVFGKAKRAIQRGATAVIFDVSDTPDASDQLQRVADPLHRPVMTVQGREAAKLMSIINTQKQAQVRLLYTAEEEEEGEQVEISSKDYFNMVIFVAAFFLFSLICVFVILKVRWRNRERQLSMTTIAKRAISKLETRKYVPKTPKHKHVATPDSDTSLHSSASESCAICLEGYREDQMLRVLPCQHDFHRHCVDPWLLNKGTCPLCKVNITAQEEIPPDPVPATIHENITQTSNYHNVPPSGQRGNYMPRLYPSREFTSNITNHPHSHQGRATCPSCEGTVGSSLSSDSTRRNTHYQQACSTEHYYQNINCIHSVHEQRMLVESYRHSIGSHFQLPAPYVMPPSCQGCRYSHVGVSHRRHLFPPLLPNVRHMCETEAEREAVRTASIVAVRGSSSSDPNPSDTSVECDCCAQAGASTLFDSNRSTYGSSDNKDSSDVSSYDSYFYRDRSPSSSGDEKHHNPDETKLPSVLVRPSCGLGRNRRESDHREVAQNHVCKSQDKVEDCAQESVCLGNKCSHKKSNSSHNDRRHGALPSACRTYKPVIHMPRSQTFSSPREFEPRRGVRPIGRSSLDSYMCVRHHRVSAPPNMFPDPSAMLLSEGRPQISRRRHYSMCFDCKSVYQGHGSLRPRNSHPAFSQWRNSEGSHGASNRPNRLNVCSNRPEQDYSRLVRPMPYRPVMCEVCQRLTHVPVPRRSVVLYSEPQGSFVTIPLGEKEKYEPENGV